MKISYIFAVLFCVEFSLSHIYAQGIFLEKGEAGIFLNWINNLFVKAHLPAVGKVTVRIY